MAFQVRLQLEGVDALKRQFDALANKLRKKHLKRAMNAASKDVLWAVRARTPKRSKLLYRSLGRKVKVYPSGNVVAIVGARQGFRQPVGVRKRGKKAGETIYANPTKYLHLVELGTSRSEARHMLKDALDSKKAEIQGLIADAVDAAVAEALSKGGG